MLEFLWVTLLFGLKFKECLLAYFFRPLPKDYKESEQKDYAECTVHVLILKMHYVKSYVLLHKILEAQENCNYSVIMD